MRFKDKIMVEGAIEIGRYTDFHRASSDGADYLL